MTFKEGDIVVLKDEEALNDFRQAYGLKKISIPESGAVVINADDETGKMNINIGKKNAMVPRYAFALKEKS